MGRYDIIKFGTEQLKILKINSSEPGYNIVKHTIVDRDGVLLQKTTKKTRVISGTGIIVGENKDTEREALEDLYDGEYHTLTIGAKTYNMVLYNLNFNDDANTPNSYTYNFTFIEYTQV